MMAYLTSGVEEVCHGHGTVLKALPSLQSDVARVKFVGSLVGSVVSRAVFVLLSD